MKNSLKILGILIITSLSLISCGFSDNSGYTQVLLEEECGTGLWTYGESDLIKDDISSKKTKYSSFNPSGTYAAITQYSFKYDNYHATYDYTDDYYRMYSLEKLKDNLYLVTYSSSNTRTTSKNAITKSVINTGTTSTFSSIEKAFSSIVMDTNTSK